MSKLKKFIAIYVTLLVALGLFVSTVILAPVVAIILMLSFAALAFLATIGFEIWDSIE